MEFNELIKTLPLVVQEKLENLKNLCERPDFHPEANTFEHIKIVTERLIKTGSIELIVSGIFHDICKFDVMRINPKSGFPTSPGHEFVAVKFIDSNKEIQDWIRNLGADLEKVKGICENHTRITQLPIMRETKRNAYITEWKSKNILGSLLIFSRADDMLTEF